MKRLVVLSIIAAISACATPEPSHGDLHQGVPRPPARPVFVPRQDAPHKVGQPGTLAPPREYPRAPPGQRVLPQTPESRNEPGIWATGSPPSTQKQPAILGVPIPFGDNLPDPRDWWLTEGCGVMMDKAARAVVGKTILPPALLRCLVAQQYYTCAMGALEADIQAIKAGNADVNRSRVIEDTAKTALRFVQHMCTDDITNSPDLRDWAKRITTEADRQARGGVQ
jgi:hypothetical protein